MDSILETAIFEMGRKAKGESFSPAEVVKWIFPQAWTHFMVDIEEVMMKLYREGKISVTLAGEDIPKDHLPKGPVRIKVNR
jgi:hypothetical protein